MNTKPIENYYRFVLPPGEDCKAYAQKCIDEVLIVLDEYSFMSHDEETRIEYLQRNFFDMPVREAEAWIETGNSRYDIDRF
tara:strand:+ start:493 stop:735 length:243 start_codon:yes stop_codon:yes gene_type:complete